MIRVSLQKQISLFVLLASAACFSFLLFFTTGTEIEQHSEAILELNMERTVVAVTDRLFSAVHPVGPGAAAEPDDDLLRFVTPDVLDDMFAPYSFLQQYGAGENLTGLAYHSDVACILDGRERLWSSVSPYHEAERCALDLPLPGDCSLSLPSRSPGILPIAASESCFFEHDGYYYLTRRVRLHEQELVIRASKNSAPHRDSIRSLQRSVTQSGLLLSLLLSFLMYLALYRLLRPLRQFTDDAERFWESDTHRQIRKAGYPVELARVGDKIDRFIVNLKNIRQDLFHRIRVLSTDVRHQIGEMKDYQELLETQGSLRRDQTEEVFAIFSVMRGKVDGYIEAVLDLEEKSLLPSENVEDYAIDAMPVLREAIKDAKIVTGKSRNLVTFPPLPEPGDTEDGGPAIAISGRDLPERHLASVLFDLSTNAFKYSDKEIRISVEKVGDMVKITMENDGQKLPREHPERIWEWRYRADSTGKESGHGIGLASVRRFVDDAGGRRHQGDSALGGACIAIELPAA